MPATADFRRHLTDIENAISRQKITLASLERVRDALQNKLDATATFPVVTLPVEVTTKIFSLWLPHIGYLRDGSWDVASVLEYSPVVLMGVCRAWRDITLATPVLWATLYLHLNLLDPDFVAKPGSVEGYIDRWLNRAGPLPLSIILTAHQTDDPLLVTPIRLRELIRRYAYRIRYLELDMRQDDIRELGLDSCSFPLLRQASLGDCSSKFESNPIHVYGNASQLRELLLFRGNTFTSYTLPSLQLTKFEGEIDDLRLLVEAPNLTEVRCSVVELSSLPSSPISHARLESLALLSAHFGMDSPMDIFPYITLPALRSLHISDMGNSPVYTESFHPFLTRSSPPIQTLSVDVEHDAFTDWEPCLSCVGTTLENLELHYPNADFQDGVFNLDDEESPENSLPQLRTLTFVGAHTKFEELAEFLHKRSTTPYLRKIRSFRLTGPPGFFLQDEFSVMDDTDEYQWDHGTNHFAKLATRGIDIRIGNVRNTYVNHTRYVPGDEAYEVS